MGYPAVVFIFFALLFDRLNIFFYVIISSIIHETGHIIACLLCKTKPVINLSLFGIRLSSYPDDKSKKMFVLLAGPVVNISAAIISYIFSAEKYSLHTYVFFAVNMVVFCFNMLPVNFLDGGQILNLVCDNAKIRKLADFLSLASVFTVIIYLSENIVYSSAAAIVFLIYYIINHNKYR